MLGGVRDCDEVVVVVVAVAVVSVVAEVEVETEDDDDELGSRTMRTAVVPNVSSVFSPES